MPIHSQDYGVPLGSIGQSEDKVEDGDEFKLPHATYHPSFIVSLFEN